LLKRFKPPLNTTDCVHMCVVFVKKPIVNTMLPYMHQFIVLWYNKLIFFFIGAGSNIRTTSELRSSVRNTSSFENSYPSRPDRNNQSPGNRSVLSWFYYWHAKIANVWRLDGLWKVLIETWENLGHLSLPFKNITLIL